MLIVAASSRKITSQSTNPMVPVVFEQKVCPNQSPAMNRTTQLYRNGYLSRDESSRATMVTRRGIAAVSLIDDVLEEQAFAIRDDAPIHEAQISTITRAMQMLSRWIARAG